MTKTESGIVYHEPTISTWRSEGYFTMPLNYRESSKVHLFDELTPLMNRKMRDEYYEREMQKGNPVPANAELIGGILDFAVGSGNPDLVKRIRSDLERYWIGTSTLVEYEPSGNGRAIHNAGTSDEYCRGMEEIIGPSEWLGEVGVGADSILKGTFGLTLEKAIKISQVINSQVINDVYGYVLRQNENPKEKIRYAVGLAVTGRFFFDCRGDLLGQSYAFRVLLE